MEFAVAMKIDSQIVWFFLGDSDGQRTETADEATYLFMNEFFSHLWSCKMKWDNRRASVDRKRGRSDMQHNEAVNSKKISRKDEKKTKSESTWKKDDEEEGEENEEAEISAVAMCK